MADAGSMSPLPAPGQVVRSLSEELVHASDSKILKVTRMIDMLASRGEADQLLSPVRARLATLRPTRPMTRTRLLFTPLDTVVVGAMNWKPGDLTIPRSLIRPLATLILDAIPGQLPAALDDTDHAALTRIGGPLWAEAACFLKTLQIPAAWAMPAWQKLNGLTVAMVTELASALQVVLQHATTIRTLPPQGDAAREQALNLMLADAAEASPTAWGIMLALLLDVATPDRVIRTAVAVARGHRYAARLLAGIDQATSDTLDRMEALVQEPSGEEPLDPGRLLARVALIGRIEHFRRLELRPVVEQQQVARLRQALATANRLIFETNLLMRLPGPPVLSTAGCVAPLTGEAIGLLEAGARQLRGFALAAARLGDADDYDRLLDAAAARYADAEPQSGLLAADRLRLAELLIGSERAIEMMDRS